MKVDSPVVDGLPLGLILNTPSHSRLASTHRECANNGGLWTQEPSAKVGCSSQLVFNPRSHPLGADPQLPARYVLSSRWVLNQSAQHEPAGFPWVTFTINSLIRPARTRQARLDTFYIVPVVHPQQYPLGTFAKYPQETHRITRRVFCG